MKSSSRPVDVLRTLFDRAFLADEFEFCSTLLRIRGMEGPGWDPLFESQAMALQLTSQISAPIEDRFRLRLILLLYCHLTEMNDLYNIVGNLLRILSGQRYNMMPFSKINHPSEKDASTPTAKKERIKEWAVANDCKEVGELFDDFLLKPVRNAFFHSDYIITDDSFNIRYGEPVLIGHELTRKIPLEWLIPKLELGINTGIAVIQLTAGYIQSYKSDKIVKGRFTPDGRYSDIQLTTEDGHGLTGFKTPPDPEFLKTNTGEQSAAANL